MLDSPRRPANTGPALGRLVAHSQAMRQLMALVRAIAPSDYTALITGETGAGKECVARAIHALSPHGAGRFLALHCAAIPPTLLESELFGHERGAYTGAEARQKGAFEAAGGGTFLLDEIGELEPALQVKLLRVLQEKEITRLGSTEPVAVDVRILATTNRNLRAEAEKGAFRPDLFYRLNTVEIHVPPLRERREDILALAGQFLAEASAKCGLHNAAWGMVQQETRDPQSETRNGVELSPAAAACLLRYTWPGNVRELRSVIERACLLCAGARIEPRHLPAEVVQPTLQIPAAAGDEGRGTGEGGNDECRMPNDESMPRDEQPIPSSIRHSSFVIRHSASAPPLSPPLDFRSARREFERGYFVGLLAECRGNISAAARSAGLSWKHFRHKMYKLQIRLDA